MAVRSQGSCGSLILIMYVCGSAEAGIYNVHVRTSLASSLMCVVVEIMILPFSWILSTISSSVHFSSLLSSSVGRERGREGERGENERFTHTHIHTQHTHTHTHTHTPLMGKQNLTSFSGVPSEWLIRYLRKSFCNTPSNTTGRGSCTEDNHNNIIMQYCTFIELHAPNITKNCCQYYYQEHTY